MPRDTITFMRTKKFQRPALLLLAASLPFCHASAQRMKAEGARCQAMGSAAEETRCFVLEAQASDKELNTV